jgi:putative ABC transport system permease protein
METFWQDVRHGARMLARNPGFTAVALLTLALGIGPNTAVFSVVHAVLLSPPPYADPQSIVSITQTLVTPAGPRDVPAISTDTFQDWRESTATLAHMAFYAPHTLTLTGHEEPVRLTGARVSPAMFDLLRIQPFAGRAFTAEEEKPGSAPVVMLTYEAWERRFARDRALVGKPLTLDGEAHTVAGILPAGLAFPSKETEFWLPMQLQPPMRGAGERRVMMMPAVARLKAGVTVQAAEVEGNGVLQRSQTEDRVFLGGAGRAEPRLRLVSLHERTVGQVRPALLVMLGAVGLVLLIASANVANLLLTRAADRQRELSIRAALGAGRARLLRQMMTESLLLGLCGGTAGLLLGLWGIYLLPRIAPGDIPRLDQVGLSLPLLAFTFGIALLTGLLCGLAPALRSSGVNLMQAIKEGATQGTAGFQLLRSNRLRSTLAVTEMALALMLLVGAGLLITSFLRLVSQDPGYDPNGVLTVQMQLPRPRYPQPEQQTAFFERVLEGVRALPEVRSAGVAALMPLSRTGINLSFAIPGQPPPGPDEEPRTAGIRMVSSGLYDALGIQLHAGRDFGPLDTETGPPVVAINESLAKRYFGSENPVGRQIMLNGLREIIAVVRDIRPQGFDSQPAPEFFVPYRQFGRMMMMGPPSEVTLVVRTAGDPLAVVPAVRGVVLAADPQLAIYNITTMERQLSLTAARPRFYASLLGIFAGFALALAAVGIYGILSYNVAQCTREIGIRMALGARRADVLALVLRQGVILAATGIALGLVGAWAASRLVASLLFGTQPTDPLIYAALALVMAAIAAVAAYVPARRATAIDPSIALRYE